MNDCVALNHLIKGEIDIFKIILLLNIEICHSLTD